MTIVILACTMVGQSMEDALNPRLKVGHLSVRRFRLRPLARKARRGVSREPMLSVEDLHVWFDLAGGSELHAVQGVSFDLRPGERMGLVGESGCGKTTTILAMMGLLPSSASVGGSVFLDGENIMARGEDTVSPHRWKDIAMVFQGAMNAFNPVKTIGSQIVEPMELHGTATGKAARGQTRELLELVGISGDRVNNYPHEFSGGMRQRAAIALALACEPEGAAGRRADDGAGRDGAGADPGAARAADARPRPLDDPGHARPAGRGAGLRSGGGDVRRRDRRDGRDVEHLPRPAASLHAHAVRRPRPTCSATPR